MERIKHFIRNTCQWVINSFFTGHHFWTIKRGLLRVAGVAVGNRVRVVGPIYFTASLSIGNDTFIGRKLEIHGNGSVMIGDKCDIAPEVSFLTGSHELGDHTRRAGKGVAFHIVIGNGCWIGAKSTILGNTEIGDGCMIGANALVNRSYEADSLIVGIPGKCIRHLD